MVGINDQYHVEIVWQVWVGALSKYRLYLYKLLALLALPHFINRFFINVYRIDFAFSAYARGHPKCEIPEAAADVRHSMPRLQP
jgi:hypothetical protein